MPDADLKCIIYQEIKPYKSGKFNDIFYDCIKKISNLIFFSSQKMEEDDLVIDLKENFKLWNCAHCPKTFLQSCNYKTHLKVHGLNLDHLYICPICGKDFVYKNSLAIHLGTHQQQQQKQNITTTSKSEVSSTGFSCHFCPKQFVFKSDLDKHENIHTKKRKYVCDICSKIFVHLTSLRVHLK